MAMNPFVRSVTDYLKSKNILVGERPLGDNLMYRCPFHHGDSENFGVHMMTGQWNCFKCKKRGRNAQDLLDALGVNDSGLSMAAVYDFVDLRLEILKAFEVNMVDFDVERDISKSGLLPVTCGILDAPPAIAYLQGRGMDVKLLAEAGVLYSPYGEYGRRIVLPWVEGGEVIGFSARSIDSGDYTRKMLRPKGAKQEFNIYNPTGRPFKGSRVVLSEGEFSAWAVCHLGYHAGSIFGSYLHAGQVNLLLEAEEVILLLDGDNTGRYEAPRALAALSGFVPKVRIAHLPDEKDPADIFLADPELLRSCIEGEEIESDLVSLIRARL